ncbi:MAG: VTC domain-containing protein, partial [Flavobacteriales bacterium]|nr:VTC domain-containing protein [Flavobacteriales bacterium]
AFLEHKFKSNKGKTIKKRLRIDMMSKSISDEEQQFLRDNEIVDPLKNVLESEFLRVTFVSKDYSSRITLDMNLEYRNEMQTFRFPKLSVLEIKSSDPNLGSKMFKGNSEIFQTGFSKYCFGMIYLYPQLKNNNFKPLFLRLKKMGVI